MVVVQSNPLNRVPNYPLSIVVPLSSTGKPAATHIRIEASESNGLDHTSFAKCEQILTVPASDLKDRRGTLSPNDLYRIKEGLRISLGL